MCVFDMRQKRVGQRMLLVQQRSHSGYQKIISEVTSNDVNLALKSQVVTVP